MTRWLRRVPVSVWALLIVLAPMAYAAFHAWTLLPPHDGSLVGSTDPDPWLRLVLVRDWLSGGSWYDHTVYRSNAPFNPTVSPWTRPLDLVIALLVDGQWWEPNISVRLLHAALLNPLLWMGLLLLGIRRNLHVLAMPPAAFIVASVMIGLDAGIHNYFGTGNADHHSMLATVFVWALGSVLTESPCRRDTVITGVLLGLFAWISPEAIAPIAVVYGWYGMLWLTRDPRAAPLPLLAVTVALTCTLAVMIERPYAAWFTPVYDSISIVYVALFTIAALGIFVLYAMPVRRIVGRFAAAMCALAVLAGILVHCYPPIVHGPLAEVDPYIHTHFLPQVMEAQPITHQPGGYILATLLQPALALVLLAVSRRFSAGLFTHAQRACLLYLVGAILPLYAWQLRFYYYVYPLVVLCLAPFLAALLIPEHPRFRECWPARWLAALPPQAQSLRRSPLLLGILGLPLALLLLTPDRLTPEARRVERCQTIATQLIQNHALEHALGSRPLTLFAPNDVGTQLLFFTPYRIIASNYHREGPGIRYLWEAFSITSLPELRRYLARRQVDALLLCPYPEPLSTSVLQAFFEGNSLPHWLTAVDYPIPPVPGGIHPMAAETRPLLLRISPAPLP